ncbi:hypothetical protein SynMVIR181_00626 [Synechococcus sp. MVIR-18-1]|nr:hypothetical protein SynMVIR181_00626 [Synechococcus sp. MVIR-18-1]
MNYNNFYFEKDAEQQLRDAGYEPLYFTRDVVRVETVEQPYWFYHIIHHLELLTHEVNMSLEIRGVE